MKRNLSKNTLKSIAIGLAIAMGSFVAVSNVSGNLIEVNAQNQQFENITNPDFKSTKPQAGHYIVTEGNLLFKIKSIDDAKKIGEAEFIGVGNLNAISTQKNANGDKIPFKATLDIGFLNLKNHYIIAVKNIGNGIPLKTFTISENSAPQQGAVLNTISVDDVNKVLFNAENVATKAFDGIEITGTTEFKKVTLPRTLTHLEANSFGGVAKDNTDTPVFIDATAISDFTNFQATAFDKCSANQNRTVKVELANHIFKAEFAKLYKDKAHVNHTERQGPTITSVSYKGGNTVELTANEDLNVANPLETFTITKKDGQLHTDINVTNAKVEDSAKNTIVLTLDKAIDENGTYLLKYEISLEDNKRVKDTSGNLLPPTEHTPEPIEFTVDSIAPAVTSIEISDNAKDKIVITFDKEIKQKAANEQKLKDMFTVNKNALSKEKATINSAKILDNIKVELTLSEALAYGDVLTVSYKKDNTNHLQSKSDVDVENFENKKVENNIKLALNKDDIVNANGYTFKVLDGNQSVALTGKKLIKNSHNNGTVENGVVSIGGNNINVTQIGDGIKALDGDNFNIAELNNIIPKATTIETKAFDGKTLEGATKISFPKVTAVKANGLGIKAGCKTVDLPSVGLNEANNVVAVAFKSTSGTNSVTKVKVKEEAKETLKDKFNGVIVDKIVVAPTANQTIDMGNLQFTILTEDNNSNDNTTVGTVKLSKVKENNAINSTSKLKNVKLKNGVLSGSIDDETFIYNFTEINIETGKERLNADKFKKLDISKVTKIASETFTNSTLPAEVTFPSVVELEANSFKSVNGLKTLILPSLNSVQINIINNQAFGNNNYQTSVNTLKVNKETAYALKNYFVNNSVKVKPIKASSGTLDKVVISGKKGDSLSQDIIIKIENEYLNNLNDVTHWFTNLPDGLTAKAKDKPKGELKQVIVTISGVPTQLSSEKVQIIIPSKDLTFGADILVNTEARFDITEKSSTGGGSGSGSSSQLHPGSVSLGNKDKQTVTSENTSEITTAENKSEIFINANTVFKKLKINEINLPTITASAANFSDVPAKHWASESIGKLSSAGIIKGVPGGGFNANANSKRADVAIMLTRLLGLENEASTARFSDVSPNAYYANAVGVAKEYGIIKGNANGTFNPESYISRQDTMVMISRILDNLNISTNADTTVLAQFSDTTNISTYALEATSKLVKLGIINGNNGKINPKHPITRAEIAVIMNRVYDIIDKTVKEETTETTSETISSSETTTETTTQK